MEMNEPFNTVLSEQSDLLTKTWERTEALLQEAEMVQAAAESGLQQLYLAVDENGWNRIGLDRTTDDFDRRLLSEIIAFAKAMYLHNPMIHRPVEVQKLYVWALGYSITSQSTVLKTFIQDFLKLRKNRDEFSHDGLKEKEGSLQYSGNIFLVFFPNPVTGDLRIRSVNVGEIEDIYTNPGDKREPWFYKRVIKTAIPSGRDRVVWHPDWDYSPVVRTGPPRDAYDPGYESWEVDWEHPIFHIKTGGTDNMKFGFPEVFSAIPWATALKRFYENWSKMMESYAKVAMQMVRSDKGSMAASKSKVTTGVNGTGQRLIGDNGSSSIAQWMMQSGGVKLEAVRTAGATTSTDEGRGLAKMVAAGVGLPLTFFGDLDNGSEATATTLDRPTELRMVDRQTQWGGWMSRIFQYAMLWSARANQGVLRQAGFQAQRFINRIDGVYEWRLVAPEGSTTDVSLEFPDILERNATERVRALIMGVTLMGKTISSIIPDRKYVTRKLLEALGESADVIEQTMEEWDKLGVFEDNQDMDAINPAPEPILGPSGPDVPEPAGSGDE